MTAEPATATRTPEIPFPPPSRKTFAEVSAVRALAPERFTAQLDARWGVEGKINGGYMVAVLARAALATQKAPAVLAASAHFLRAPAPGEVEISVELLRAGRSTSHVRARLSQAGRACVEAMFTVGVLGAGTTGSWSGTVPAPSAAPLADCIRLQPDPRMLSVPLLEQVDVRLSPETMGWAMGRPTGRGELTGWITLPEGAAFDPVSLLFAVDAFPPATFDIELTGWVPTFQLSAYVRALPVTGPVQVLQRAQVVADGRVDESCYVWDQAGTLVAHSTQLAGVRLS